MIDLERERERDWLWVISQKYQLIHTEKFVGLQMLEDGGVEILFCAQIISSPLVYIETSMDVFNITFYLDYKLPASIFY